MLSGQMLKNTVISTETPLDERKSSQRRSAPRRSQDVTKATPNPI